MARIYEISYPTVRLRLDRLIQKIEILDSQEEIGPFEECLRLLYTEGKVDMSAMKRLRQAYTAEKGVEE